MGRSKTNAKKNKGKKPGKAAEEPVKTVPVEESDSDSESESGEEELVVQKVTKSPNKSKNNANKKRKSPEPESDESSEEEVKTPAKKAKKSKLTPKPAVVPVAMEEDSDLESDSDEEEEEEEEDEDGSDSSHSEDEPAPKAKQQKSKMKKKSAAPVEDWDMDSKDSEDDDDKDGEEPKEKKHKKKKVKNGDVIPDSNTVFIANIPREYDNTMIEKWFTDKGLPVAEVRRSRPNRPFAYVDLVNLSDQAKAVSLHLELMNVNKLTIEKARPKPTQTPKKPDPPKTTDRKQTFASQDEKTLFVKNLPESATEDSLKDFFPDAEEIRLPRTADQSHKGFAYIVLENKEKVEEMMNEKQGADMDGNALYLDFSGKKSKFQSPAGGGGDRRKSSGEAGKSKVLFVKNLSYDTDENALKEAFDGCSTARVARYPDTNKHRGFGFVEFDTPEAAKEAHESMQSHTIDGRDIFIDFAGDRSSGGGGRGGGRGGGFRGGRGGRGGGFRGGRGGRGGFGGRGGGGRGGRGGFGGDRKGIKEFQGKKKTFNDSD